MTATVLVTDDSEDVRFLLRLELEAEGWNVAEAADGPQALAFCGQQPPAAIVLDERMPGMRGIEVAEQLRASGFDGVIVLYTAYLDPRLGDRLDRLDAVAVSKTDREGLLTHLREHCAGHA